MKTYIQDGLTLHIAEAVADVVSGMLVIEGSMPVVPATTALTGEPYEGVTEGVFKLPKTLANTPAFGAKAYLKADGTEVTTTLSGNTLVGIFTEARTSSDTHAYVRLNGVSV